MLRDGFTLKDRVGALKLFAVKKKKKAGARQKTAEKRRRKHSQPHCALTTRPIAAADAI